MWREGVEGVANGFPKSLNGTRCGLSQQSLELREHLLDWIEVWAVGRKIDQLRSYRFDGLANARHFVAGQIIHDNDVVLFKRWNQELFNVGAECFAVHGAIQRERRSDAVVPQRRRECCRFPMAKRFFTHQALAFAATPVTSRHFRCRACFVDEHKFCGIKFPLVLPPFFASRFHVRSVLLAGVNRFFL